MQNLVIYGTLQLSHPEPASAVELDHSSSNNPRFRAVWLQNCVTHIPIAYSTNLYARMKLKNKSYTAAVLARLRETLDSVRTWLISLHGSIEYYKLLYIDILLSVERVAREMFLVDPNSNGASVFEQLYSNTRITNGSIHCVNIHVVVASGYWEDVTVFSHWRRQ